MLHMPHNENEIEISWIPTMPKKKKKMYQQQQTCNQVRIDKAQDGQA